MRRAGFLTWHRRLALLFAPLLLMQALTGAVLLFHAPLTRMIYPVVGTEGTLPVSRLVEAAGLAVPQARVTRLYLPETAHDAARAELLNRDDTIRYVALDAATARVLQVGGYAAFPLEAALQWHYRLMDGTTGLAIVLANGLVLILLAGSGMAFWWPAKGRFAKSLAINARMPGRVRLRHWHRSGGVVAAIAVLFSAMTGVLLAAPDVLPVPAAAEPAFVPMPEQIDAAVAVAQRQFPHARIRDVRFAQADRLAVNFFAPARNPRAVHVVAVRLSAPEVLKSQPAATNDVLWMKVLPLHTGESFGLLGQLFLLIEALVLAALAISGPWMWWQARRLRK